MRANAKNLKRRYQAGGREGGEKRKRDSLYFGSTNAYGAAYIPA